MESWSIQPAGHKELLSPHTRYLISFSWTALWLQCLTVTNLSHLNVKGIWDTLVNPFWHRIIEKRSLSPELQSSPLNYVTKSHIHLCLKYLAGWWFDHFTREPVPVLANFFFEEVPPYVPPEAPLAQPEDCLPGTKGWPPPGHTNSF